MNGTFAPEKYKCVYTGTLQGMLSIEIPAPYARESKEEAIKDGQFTYRFVCVEGEVLIAVYPGEAYQKYRDGNGVECLKVWTKGHPFHFYNYQEFKRLGGIIYEMPENMICQVSEHLSEEDLVAAINDWKSNANCEPAKIEDYEVKATFTELFPSLAPGDNPIYIDNEAYIINEEN